MADLAPVRSSSTAGGAAGSRTRVADWISWVPEEGGGVRKRLCVCGCVLYDSRQIQIERMADERYDAVAQ